MILDTAAEIEHGVSALAAWASRLSFDSIPDAVRRRAALVIADDLSCAVGSRDEPELHALKERLPRGAGEATILLGGDTKTDRIGAAMINAIGSNWCQLDEGHRHVMCHAGLYVVPAALAEAEATGQSLRDLLRAIVIGYEVVCRFAQTFHFAKPSAHPHAMWSPLGATAAVAALRGLDAKGFCDAITTAVTMAAAGPFGHAIAGALVANAWAGLGVATGFRCVDLVQCGISGLIASPFETFTAVLGAEANPVALDARLGEKWALNAGYHKVYSCAQQSHAAVEAMLQLVWRRWPAGKTTRDVSRIVVEGHGMVLSMDNRAPRTTLAARFSVPHIIAAVCVQRRADLTAFSGKTLNDEEITRLRNLTELKLRMPLLPPPHDRAARVTLAFRGGPLLSEECLSAEGGPDRPLPDEAIMTKCAALTKEVYPNFANFTERVCSIDTAMLEQRCADVIRDAVSR